MTARLLICLLLTTVLAHAANPSFQANPQAAATPPAKNADVSVVFKGAIHFREEQLKDAIHDQLQSIQNDGLNPASADDAAFFLGLFYEKNGYAKVNVQSAISGGTLVLTIAEGPFVALGENSFTGNAYFPAATLREYIVGTTRERFSALQKTLPYVEADVQSGVDRLRGLYAAEGFLDVTIADPQITFTANDAQANILVAVHEGTQYHFGAITFTGDVPFARPTLLAEIEKFSKLPYTPFQVTSMERAVGYFYKTHGYFQVTVQTDSDPTQNVHGVVPVHFTLKSGPVFHFGKITTHGMERLHAGFLPKRFGKLTGKLYNPAALDAVFRDMMRTGLFKRLRVNPKAEADHTVTIDLSVEEAPAKELGFSTGYGTYEGFILGISLGDLDLFGTGRPLTTSLEFSQRYIKGEILYSDPWFMDGPLAEQIRLYGISVSFDGYDKIEYGAREQLSYQLTKSLNLAAFIQTRLLNVTSTGIDEVDLGLTSYHVNSIGLTESFDLRADRFNPAGFVINGALEYATSALGSSIDLVRGTVSATYYIPFGRSLLGFGFRAGALESSGSQPVPIDERFFNGGSRSVRSFTERDLGPHDRHGNPLGGNSFSVMNVEYDFPLVGDLGGAVFFDAGSVGAKASDAFSDLRYGIGAGLRYKLPIGPLRLDYGYNPDRRPGEDIGAFHFSFGFAF
jgi:outer membrane protein assembly complex protein YaeT